MQSTTLEQLSAADAQVILEHLPERIRAALIARAADIEYPIEAVVEMAICLPSATRTLASSMVKHLVLLIANQGAVSKEFETVFIFGGGRVRNRTYAHIPGFCEKSSLWND
ncbi:hypothetical protein [Microseira sp. BLCC-F43]|jgi:hypothetical protein|uniref:hypothetical protein n=1 Tax=Microseira sp. BLCC-F43 TaxID=3153602 RepID=UPI0035B75934